MVLQGGQKRGFYVCSFTGFPLLWWFKEGKNVVFTYVLRDKGSNVASAEWLTLHRIARFCWASSGFVAR